MHVNVDPREMVHVARQPIFDRSDRVVGYELLYWDNAAASACLTSSDVAVTRVLTDAMLTLGLDTLTGGLPAFLGVTRRVLIGCAGGMLPPASTVFQLRDEIEPDAEVLDACKALHREGYSLAIDRFTLGSEAERLLAYAKYVTVDVRATTPTERQTIANRLLARGLLLVAKNIDTAPLATEVRASGYSYVQGFYFCKPITFTSRTVPSRRLAYVQLLGALNKPHLSVNELEDLVKHDASMSYRVLRCVNSAAFGAKQEVESIRHAIMLLGFDQIRQWASTWALAGANQNGPQELAVMAILRARCCELLGESLNEGERGGEFFLLGLCSLLDAILGQPLDQALAPLPVTAGVHQALLGGAGQTRQVLDAVVAYERGDWTGAAATLREAGGDPSILPATYNDALVWARELLRAQAA